MVSSFRLIRTSVIEYGVRYPEIQRELRRRKTLVETSELLSGGLSGGLETRLYELVEFRSFKSFPPWKIWTKSVIIMLANTHKLDEFR